MSPASKWLLASALLVAGIGLLAASYRERERVSRTTRAKPAPPPVEPAASESGHAAGGVDPSAPALTPGEARLRLHRAGATTAERRDAMRELVERLSADDARPLLLEALFDPGESFPVRSQALALLPRVGADVETLRRLLSDRTFAAPHLVVKALADLDDPRVASVLASTLREDLDDSARVQAARGLAGRAGRDGAAATALRDAALADRSENVRLAALSAYLESGDAGAREFARQVESLAGAPPRLRLLARRWLSKE